MSFSRRNFFRKLVQPNKKTQEERLARYEQMDQYVRTELLPYDFALTAEQQNELFAAVRKALEQTDDEELFSAIIRFRVDDVVDVKVRLWREQNRLDDRLK